MQLSDVKNYCRIDEDADDALLTGVYMPAAESIIQEAVGEFDDTNPKACLLYYALIADMYDQRKPSIRQSERQEYAYTYQTIILQLQTDQLLKEAEQEGGDSDGE